MLVRILNKPAEQPHQIFKFLFVAPADNSAQMPQKTTLLLPAFAQFNVKSPPQVKFVRLSCAAGFENEIKLVPVRTFLPKLLNWA